MHFFSQIFSPFLEIYFSHSKENELLIHYMYGPEASLKSATLRVHFAALREPKLLTLDLKYECSRTGEEDEAKIPPPVSLSTECVN